MFKLRGCPKCRGDLYASEDVYGAYLACVQCGRHFFVSEIPAGAGGEAPAAPPSRPPELAELDLAA